MEAVSPLGIHSRQWEIEVACGGAAGGNSYRGEKKAQNVKKTPIGSSKHLDKYAGLQLQIA